MKLGEAKAKALKLIAEWSNNGNLITATPNADYTLRMNDLAQAAQMEIATVRKINASYVISQNPITNQLGDFYPFNLLQHLDSDNVQSTAIGSKSYYFEVDRQGTVYIEEQISGVWTILITITVPNTVTSFTPYKGLISPSSALNSVRIRFSGLYPYNIRNRALFAYTFPTTSDIPNFTPYQRYDMPSDYMELKKVDEETDPQKYVRFTKYEWEGKKTFVVSRNLKGNFRIEYYRYPTIIDSTTDDNYAFEVDLEAQEAIPYYLAAHAAIDEPQKQNMVSTYLNIYQQKVGNLGSNDNTNRSNVSNAMGW